MPTFLRALLVLPLVLMLSQQLSAATPEPFMVQDIEINGLQRISPGTVFNALPVRVGESVDAQGATQIIRALYRTGFFENIELGRSEDVLVIAVVERPSVASIELIGNKAVPEDVLLEGLKDAGLSEGRVFVPAILEALELELQRQYFAQGRYSVEIDTQVTPLPRNRVAVAIEISEGKVAKIRDINLIGNTLYDDDRLLSEFESSTPSLSTIIGDGDKYSRQTLAADIETLKSFYFDRGYLDFEVVSSQVAITPDRDSVFITITMSEGAQYQVKEIALSGKLIVEPEELIPLVGIRPGDIFSRTKVSKTQERLTEKLSDEGYAFANVNAIPDVDQDNHQVSFTFFIDPGKRVYVRRINMGGNTKTQDQVLRREMRQMESGWFSAAAVERSRVRLQRLGFFEEVNLETPAVPGTTDQVDVEYSVVERASGSISAGIGFGQSSGLLLNTSVTQENFLGSGNRVAVNFSNSSVNTIYSFSFTDPYYTLDGVSRSFSLFWRTTESDDANITEYDISTLGGNVGFGLPINEYDSIGLSAGIEQTTIDTNQFTAQEIVDFVNENSDSYSILRTSLSWSHDTRNKSIFPDRGVRQSVSGEIGVPGGDLQFYKLRYDHQWYKPVKENLTLLLQGNLGYGDGYGSTTELPIFENFFAGGQRSVRGFEANSLGPEASDGDPLGGNVQLTGKAELLFPPPFMEKTNSLRLSGFFDIGNVYSSDEDIALDELRYSAGVGVTWLSPVGALTFSFAQPFNVQDDDDEERFQFNLGASF
ncbi:MAG: outer membrane protein assembly factor BamA [Gammaproteobacteria bacterium]|nr:outer membrane protein assembly factor BamA [Gammaproteobacteria bacterium]